MRGLKGAARTSRLWNGHTSGPNSPGEERDDLGEGVHLELPKVEALLLVDLDGAVPEAAAADVAGLRVGHLALHLANPPK